MTGEAPPPRATMRMAMIDGDYGKAIAFRIRAELVCCYIYDGVQKEAARGVQEGVPDGYEIQNAIGRAIIRGDWHDLCYWAEAAAQIAEGRCPGHETEPNICRCPCEGCKHNCSAHDEGTPWVPTS